MTQEEADKDSESREHEIILNWYLKRYISYREYLRLSNLAF